MFDHRHYVPILRWKRGEWVALRHLSAGDRTFMTPLVELTEIDWPMLDNDARQARLRRIATRVGHNWGHGSIFVDARRLGSERDLQPLELLCSAGRRLGLSLIPVLTRHCGPDVIAAVRKILRADRKGVCLRLFGEDLKRHELAVALQSLLLCVDEEASNVDLIIDYGAVALGSPNLRALTRRVPRILEWRTFTVAAGAFPKDLSDFHVGQHLCPREDWRQWMSQVASDWAQVPRVPTYGDYATQHPIFKEPSAGLNPSASIRYTIDDYWLILRGEGLRTKGSPGSAQYQGNAQLLSEMKEFSGENFSYGDQYVATVASGKSGGFGSPETWLCAGVNHHLVYVARQIPSSLDRLGVLT